MMHPSVGEQFRAALLGMAIGECWSALAAGLAVQEPRSPWLIQPLPFRFAPAISLPTLPHTDRVLAGVEGLVHQRAIVPESWHGLVSLPAGTDPATVALYTVPLALFLHEDERKAVQQIQNLLSHNSHPLEAIETASFLALMVSRGLRGRLHLPTLIANLLADGASRSMPIGDRIIPLLQTLQSLLKSRADLQTAIKLLTENQPFTTFGLALYCWLSTPNEFQISVGRGMYGDRTATSSAPIIGILSGIYNGVAGIPVRDRIAISRIHTGSTSPDERVGFNLEEKVLREADRLWSGWCGVYEPGSVAHATFSRDAVAAPQVIRPR
ncbi:MAG: ADP-ribosylglycohydrolase family protein [Leptolyngbyaceae cyanobacterium bins.59]|nr:ADP-ribosylglycohydrolase family protein [Leptolyngbyaceae cyanobacterium bins.59]